MMRLEAEHFPGYDFDLNKGYPCPRHKMALKAWGPTSIHRRTWVFMQHIPWGLGWQQALLAAEAEAAAAAAAADAQMDLFEGEA
jgi:hypothetical protein